jgi:hypothetical protein
MSSSEKAGMFDEVKIDFLLFLELFVELTGFEVKNTLDATLGMSALLLVFLVGGGGLLFTVADFLLSAAADLSLSFLSWASLAVLRMRCALKLRQSLHRQRLEFALC